MSSRRILYDEMRDRGLLDRCGYARELYEVPNGDLKQNCVFIGRCSQVRGKTILTREQSLECPIYAENQRRMIKEYEH